MKMDMTTLFLTPTGCPWSQWSSYCCVVSCCRVYNHSMVCVDKVAGQCAGVVRDLIESAADARRESLGRLCDDQRAFTSKNLADRGGGAPPPRPDFFFACQFENAFGHAFSGTLNPP